MTPHHVLTPASLFSTTTSLENDIVYHETSDRSEQKWSLHSQRLSALKFPQDILAYATHPANSLSSEDLPTALRCLSKTVKTFYAKREEDDGRINATSGGRKPEKTQRWQMGLRKIVSDRRFGTLMAMVARRMDRFKTEDLLDCLHSLSRKIWGDVSRTFLVNKRAARLELLL